MTSEAVRLTILQTADLHGQLETHDEFYWENDRPVYRRAGGVARLKTLVERIRAENPNTIVVDNGDCFQGSGWVQLTEGEAMVEAVNALGYDVVMPGNWEVVFGKQRLLDIAGRYEPAVVCTNMHHAEPGNASPPIPRGNDVVGHHLFAPYKVIERSGVRVGVLAYNDPQLVKRQAPAYSRGMAVSTPAQSLAFWGAGSGRTRGAASCWSWGTWASGRRWPSRARIMRRAWTTSSAATRTSGSANPSRVGTRGSRSPGPSDPSWGVSISR